MKRLSELVVAVDGVWRMRAGMGGKFGILESGGCRVPHGHFQALSWVFSSGTSICPWSASACTCTKKRRGTSLKLSPRIMGQRRNGNICRILGLEATGAIFRGVGILSIGGRGTIKGWGKGVTTSMLFNISLFTLVAVSFLVLLERPGLVSAFGYGGNNSLLVNIFWLKDSAKKGGLC